MCAALRTKTWQATEKERKCGACRRPEPGKMRQHPTKPVATCAARPRWSMRLERRTPRRKKAEKIFGAHPPTPAPAATNANNARVRRQATTTKRCKRQNRHVLRIAGEAESELRRDVSSDWRKGTSSSPVEARGRQRTAGAAGRRMTCKERQKNVADPKSSSRTSWCAPL